MAIIAGEGYASEAVRLLFDNASKDQGYQLFVLHDADPYGYNIARTLGEETRRMPEYQVEVIDLGLWLEEALDLGLQTEKLTRKNDLPGGVAPTSWIVRILGVGPKGENHGFASALNLMPSPRRHWWNTSNASCRLRGPGKSNSP